MTNRSALLARTEIDGVVAHLDVIGEDVPLRRSGWDAESNGAGQGPDHI